MLSTWYLRNSIPTTTKRTTQAPITPPAIAPALLGSFSRGLVVSERKESKLVLYLALFYGVFIHTEQLLIWILKVPKQKFMRSDRGSNDYKIVLSET